MDTMNSSSEAVRRTMQWNGGIPSTQLLHHREPYAPYAPMNGSMPINNRISSAPPGYKMQRVGPVNPHRAYTPGPSHPAETTVSKRAPYASRLSDSFFYTSNGAQNGAPVGAAIPSYDSMSDPLMFDYFKKKFSNPHPPRSGKYGHGHGRPGSSTSRNGKVGSKSSVAKGNVIYKIAVTTGDRKNAGTDAKVYMRMVGTKSKLPKKQLTKKSGSGKKKKGKFKFNRGTTHVFKFEDKDIGDLVSINMEHDGLTKKEGWFLDQVEIIKKNPRTGVEKIWLFTCQNWLSLHEGDCQISRQLFAKTHSKTEYEVVCVTGSMKGAGTDANVAITIFGKSAQTPKLQLKSHSKNTFSRNQSDIFVLKTACVGPMTKVRIQHDNTGFGAGWFLDRIVVTDLKHPKWKYYFPCGQWLSKDEGDKLIIRDLIGSMDPLAVRKLNKYRVTVFTGDKRGAGTDANVYMTMFGENGDSAEIRLDSRKNNFERGQTDEFMIECPCVGELLRLRIGHDNWGAGPGWYLDKVIIDDIEQNRVYEFPCGRWLAKDEDDGQISRDLLPGLGADDAPPGVPYTIHVTTGKVENSSTSAKVFIIMYGGKGGEQSSGKIWLNKGKYFKGRTDIFNVDVADNLSPLSRIDIGHDNSGVGPGWYLDRVMVNCMSAGYEQWFLCDKWLAVDEGDGLIERTLYESEGMRKKRQKLVTWYVKVYTSDMRGAGTDANVLLVAYGKNKDGESVKSDEIRLDNKGDNFEQGECDKFKVEMIDIGLPYKIRVAHDNSGSFPGWHLDKVEMENMATKKRYTFACGRWLANDEDNGSIVREMGAEGEDIKKVQPLHKYVVSVHTGSKRGAGTDANVFINMFGDQGDTGDRALRRSKDHKNKFEKGHVDEFVVEAVRLKKLRKIRIGHDGMKAGDGWFLDKVVVKPMNESNAEEVTFECNRWLDVKEDDGLIVREITAGGSQMLSTTSYHVSVKTGDIAHAGTDANVALKIFGDKGDTGLMPLRSSDNTKNKFERGRTDLFKLEATDIGKLKRIRIGHDGSQAGSGWFLDEVNINIPSRGTNYVFACHRWLDSKEDDGQIEIEMEPSHVEKGSVRIPYEITVWTADVKGAGTDANVFLQMYGDNGKTEEYPIRNRTDNFERAQVDKFKLEAADVGPLLKIRIGHDGNGAFAGWCLDKLLIQRHPGKNSKRRVLRRKGSSRTIGRNNVEDSDSEDDRRGRRGTLSRTASTSKFARSRSRQALYSDDEDDSRSRRGGSRKGRRNSDDDDDYRSRRGGSLRNRRYSDDDEDDVKSRRNSRLSSSLGRKNKSYDSDEDDRYSHRSGRPGSARGRPGSARGRPGSARQKGRYSDSDEEDSHRGKRPNSARRKSNRHDSDEDRSPRNKKKSLLRRVNDDGDDNEEEVEQYWFVCNNKWFARDEGDKKIVRELLPTDEHGKPLDVGLKELEYTVKLFTGDVMGAGTDANVFFKMAGEFGDTGEIQLKDSNHVNKFERNQEDIFTLPAIELGKLKKVKIRHDNKGGMAAWFLDHIEVDDPKTKQTYFFPCQKWLATNKDDGQIARELVPVDKKLMKKLSSKDLTSIRDEIALETKAAMTTYHVYVYTSDKFGAGTDANVYVVLFGEQDDTGMVFLKSSRTNRDKFERGHMDEFVIEAIDIGELKKLRIGHDNAGAGGDWHLDRIEIDCPSLGKKWYFMCGRWLAKNRDDGQTEVELFPQDMATEDYVPCIPYEITTYTSTVGSAGTDADVYVVLYGQDAATSQKSLCPNKKERKRCFEKGQKDKFVIELEDVGPVIEKLRIGHDGKGMGAGWHLDRVEVRRLKASGKGSETFNFPCGRWLARGEEDGAIERELVPDKVIEETLRKDGSVKKKENIRKDTLIAKKYMVNVITGDVSGAGTDANVFLTIHGDKGDSGERKLHKSETHRDKFEKGQTDIFAIEAVDLGKLYKVKIRHDNSMLSPSWFLDRVEIDDTVDNDHYVFYCERWLAKNKEDCKIERSIYVKGYEGPMSSTSTLRSTAMGASMASMESFKSTDPFSKSPRVNRRQQLGEIPEGPTIPYTVRLRTGDEKDAGTESNAWIRIIGTKKKHTGKQYLELAQKKGFAPGSVETFSLEGIDVDVVKQIELGHDGVTPGSGWYVREVEVDMPTKGKHYFFVCKSWLAREKSDGKTSRIFTLNEGDSSMVSYKALVPYEVTIYTGDESGAGTDSKVFMKAFGAGGSTSDMFLEKVSERFERGRTDFMKMELEDIAPLRKLRIGHDGKGTRPEWFLEKVEMRNMESGDLFVFNVDAWFSKTKDDGKIVRDVVATFKGKKQLKSTQYRISVKTSDVRGAGTDANVYVVLFGENGDSGDLHLKESETNKSPFENNQTDVFTMSDLLSLGQLFKLRIWHDNKGLGAAWHLQQVEVEDMKARVKYSFPCNRWLSKSEDDKQICRELTCANLPSPTIKDKVSYEIEISTSDKTDAGTIHNAWLILEGEQRSSKEFIMENSPRNKILRRGQKDTFTMSTKNLGTLENCVLGAMQRDDRPISDQESAKATMWHCHEVSVTNKSTGDKYIFPCKTWIDVASRIMKKKAKTLKVKSVEESHLSSIRNLGTVKYEVIVHTGDVRSAGTDANVCITIYGAHSDTGKRPLEQKLRNLFERGQVDKFQLEAVDLGDINKIRIEHDNAGFGAGWFLEKVDIINMASNRTWCFPCSQWLDKKKGDGLIYRELYARD